MKTTCALLIILIAVPGLGAPAIGAGQTPAEGGVLPEIRLEAKDEAQRQYLGIKGAAPFVLHKLKAEALIIEIFSMY